MATRIHSPHPDGRVSAPRPRAVIGWTHQSLPLGIALTVESATSLVALENDQIEACNLVMTRSQALLLARYLLHATGQEDALAPPASQARHRWWVRRGSNPGPLD